MNSSKFPERSGVPAQLYFDDKYAASTDPWSFASNPYELTRYAVLLRALGGLRFRRAFEPACSIGILTGALAGICAQVEALDISPRAIALAKSRCRSHRNISFHTGELTGTLPSGTFDLLVLSEVAYYFAENELRALAKRLVAQVEPGGTVLASTWLGFSPEHRISGDRAHEVLREIPGLELTLGARHGSFRIDRWRRVPLPAGLATPAARGTAAVAALAPSKEGRQP